MSDKLTPEEVESLRDRSRLDNEMIVGSEVRQLCMTISILRGELEAEQRVSAGANSCLKELREEVFSLRKRLNTLNDERVAALAEASRLSGDKNRLLQENAYLQKHPPMAVESGEVQALRREAALLRELMHEKAENASLAAMLGLPLRKPCACDSTGPCKEHNP